MYEGLFSTENNEFNISSANATISLELHDTEVKNRIKYPREFVQAIINTLEDADT